MKNILEYIKAHKFTMFILLLALTLVGYYLLRPPTPPSYETTTVQQGTVIQEVSVTGRVNSESEVELAFEKGGRVQTIPTVVGAHVARGDVLARLDASELLALRAQAKANVEYEIANLALLKKGNRDEDIAVSLASVSSAESALSDSRKVLFDKLGSAFTNSDDVIHNTVDQFFRNPRTHNPEFTPSLSDAKTVIVLQSKRSELEDEITTWSLAVNTWDHSTDVDAASAISRTNASLGMIKDYLDLLASAINSIQSSTETSQSTIDGWRLAVSGARANINGAISSTLAGAQSYRSALAALTVAKEQLALKKAGATPESLTAQEARIVGAQATLANYDSQIAKMSLRAPFAGVVTRQTAKLGQTVTPNASIVSMMSDGMFQIETNVPEVDVAKISVGDEARVTLDAYGSDVLFDATVSAIDPAETILEGVSTYKVTLRFNKDDSRVRSGMTANIDIATNKKDNVLFIPLRAVTTKDGKKYVSVLRGDALQQVEVTLGLRGSSGTVEVVEGLTQGDTIATVATN